ncbi:MAG: hypothetical protein AMXMBFR64_15290 [Myxococcales bacterium]
MVRFVHAADLHLDTPFEGLSRVAPELRERLVDASLLALDRLVELTLAERAEALLLAGDVYDGAERGLRAQLRLLDATRRLSRAGVRVFIAHGNHDPVEEGWSAVRQWPDGVTIFPSDRVEVHRLVARDGTPFTVSGISYPRRDVRENLAALFPRAQGPGVHIAVLHANVGSQGNHAPYSPCTVDDLARTGHHYWALGHIHRHALLRAEPAIVYPGVLQGRSFKPSELGPKGAVVVDAGRRCTVRFVELAPVRFEVVEVDAAACDDVGQVAEALAAAAEGGRVLRAVVRGATPAYDALSRPEAGDALLRAVSDATPGASWADLRLDVRPPVDLDGLADRGDLLGELAAQAAGLSADDVRALLGAEAGLLGHDVGDHAELVRRAACLAITLLEE